MGGTYGSAMPQSSIFAPDTSAAVVRYLVEDLDRSVAFYTQRLGFELTQRAGPVGTVSRGALHLLLSDPRASGSKPLPDGRPQASGGSNRIVLYVDDLDRAVAGLKASGTPFRTDVQVGPGGKQIQVEDPDGNPIELHEAPKK